MQSEEGMGDWDSKHKQTESINIRRRNLSPVKQQEKHKIYHPIFSSSEDVQRNRSIYFFMEDEEDEEEVMWEDKQSAKCSVCSAISANLFVPVSDSQRI